MDSTILLNDEDAKKLLSQEKKAHSEALIDTLTDLTQTEILRLFCVADIAAEEHKRLYQALRAFSAARRKRGEGVRP